MSLIKTWTFIDKMLQATTKLTFDYKLVVIHVDHYHHISNIRNLHPCYPSCFKVYKGAKAWVLYFVCDVEF